ncbi:MAG: TlpA family protein disulfide reductase [Solirubrobacterales bacterium]
MAQLSRPYQIALLALATLVLVWFVALHRPGAGSTSSSSPSVSSAGGGSASGSSSAGGSSSVYHGAAPGVEGLSKDINKAHGAVATSEHNAQELQQKSAQASGEAAAGGKAGAAGAAASGSQGTASTHAGSDAKRHAAAVRSAQHSQHSKAHPSPAAAAAGPTAALILHHLTAATHPSIALRAISKTVPAWERIFIGKMKSYLAPASQATIAGELKHGKTVLLLFLNPVSYDDDATAIETVVAAHELGHKVSVHFAKANRVNSFGSITRDIQVYQTPTLLIINHKKQVTTLTGFTDSFAIEQAVAEARKSP